MNRNVLIVVLGLAMWLAFLECYQGQSAPAPRKAGEKKEDDDKFCVTIWPKTTCVQVGVSFDVTLRVTNATEQPQSFTVLAAAWDANWTTDNKRISLEARRVFSDRVVTEKLARGGSYDRTVNLMVKEGPPIGVISFRMGFSTECLREPMPKLGEAPAPKKREPKIYWSNRVVLGIKPGKHK